MKSSKQNKPKENHRKIAVNVRILLNYMQVISILKFIKLDWPVYISDYFNYFAYLSYCNQIFSFDCIFDDFEIKFQKLYVKTMVFQLFPFVICFMTWVFLLMMRSRDKTVKIIVVLLVVFTFFLPSGISQQLESIKCKDIEGKSYLMSNLNYICYSDEHKNWVFYTLLLRIV